MVSLLLGILFEVFLQEPLWTCHHWVLLFYTQEIAELYESEQNIEQAVVYYEKSADFYENEEGTTSANQCKQKVAQFAAQLEQWVFNFCLF